MSLAPQQAASGTAGSRIAMPTMIGIIQSGSIGDIIIALPIAKHYADRGAKVVWPIYEQYLSHFERAVPYAEFLPVKGDPSRLNFEAMYYQPLALLQARGCERIFPLYSFVQGLPQAVNADLSRFLKFDEYKYAVAEVPFREKWTLQIVRAAEREHALYSSVVKSSEYVCCHLQGSKAKASMNLKGLPPNHQLIEIVPQTDCIFDWLKVIENAKMLIMIDSCFANVVEQLNLPHKKLYIFRTPGQGTPVLRNQWQFR